MDGFKDAWIDKRMDRWREKKTDEFYAHVGRKMKNRKM